MDEKDVVEPVVESVATDSVTEPVVDAALPRLTDKQGETPEIADSAGV